MAVNFGAGLTGALGGAGTGATLGSLGGPVGTGIGAGVGGLAGLLGGLFGGGQQSPQIGNQQLQPGFPQQSQGDPRFQQVQRFTPGQQQGLEQILQQALGGLQEPLGQGFAPIAEQARTQFGQQTIPGIAERFSGLDGQRSSAFQQALGQAGAGLEQGLAGQQAQFGLQEQGLLQQLLGQGLTPQFETAFQPRTPSLLENLLPILLSQGLKTGGKIGSAFLSSKFGQGSNAAGGQ